MNISDFRYLITQKQLILELKNPYMVHVATPKEGFDIAKEMLYQVCDKKTLLLLSGGQTPKQFYSLLGKEEKLLVGSAGLIDERFGEKMHTDSNERMVRESGLLGYLEYRKIPFHSILQNTSVAGLLSKNTGQVSLKNMADVYDQTMRMLFQNFSTSVGILGIGLDGHTAGIPIHHKKRSDESDMLVSSFSDFPMPFTQRISMTFFGLSMLDLLIVLVFGEDKKKALELMFEEGSEENIPARFFKRSEIASKTLVITDQTV